MRYEVATVSYNYHHWQWGGIITIELFNRFYATGYEKYFLEIGFNQGTDYGGSPKLQLVESRGIAHNAQLSLGNPADLASSVDGYINRAIPVCLDVKEYSSYNVRITYQQDKVSDFTGWNQIKIPLAPTGTATADFTAPTVGVSTDGNSYFGGNVGIGTVPSYKLTVNGNFKTINGNNEFSYNGAADIILRYADRGTGGRAVVHDTGNTLVLNYGNDFNGGTRIGNNVFFQESGISYINSGNVGIGTPNPDELLTVNGTIHAKEIKVDLTGSLADYVFKPSYPLMPLNQVEQYVKTNSHLPDVPSAAEVSKNGMSMGEMQNKLLQKVEELTLYVIEQQKQIEELKKELKR